MSIGSDRGFTLVELILAVVIVGLVAAVFGLALPPTVQVSVNTETRKDALQNARYALDRMMREVREARSFSACAPCPATTTLNFTDIHNNNIIYTWAAGSLTRNGFAIANDVTGFSAALYNKTGVVPATQAQIWRVETTLTVTVGGTGVDLVTEANPRNVY